LEAVVRFFLFLVGLGCVWLTAPAQAQMPADEMAFVATVQNAQNQWRKVTDDIKRETNGIQREASEIRRDAMPAARAAQLCLTPRAIHDWIGQVSRIDTYTFLALKDRAPQTGYQAPASLNVLIAPGVTLRTEGDLQNAGSKIERGTELFRSVSTLAIGQAVVFSGHFIREAGCLVETSLTDNGSMTEPDFEFIFSAVR
jgi:hypothetical protein